ncbi:MAG: hypothetical protein K1X91_04290 [Bacteriodetes bacterium]|nr:hypothetical protein [Bacteroidota bacterium]
MVRYCIPYFIASVLCVSFAFSQPLQNPFNYSLNAYKALDSAYLPTAKESRPAGEDGYITINNGHFTLPNGNRARFFGTIMIGEACFPDSAAAIQVAERLHSLGFNAVKFSQFDYTNYDAASILPNASTQTSIGFDTTRLRKFDWFIYQLKKNGIYVNLVLRSVRMARRNDGIARWDSIGSSGRAVNYIEPAYRDLIAKYVNDLLMHFNPFTRTRYKDESAVAFLELDENNSIYTHWINNNLNRPYQNGNNTICYNYSRKLDTLFTQWCLVKYKDEAGIRAAWTNTPTNQNNVITKNNGFEDLFDNSWTFSTFTGGARAITIPDKNDKKEGQYSMNIAIQNPGTAISSLRFYNSLPTLQRYAMYQIKLWARTDTTKRLVTFSIANFAFRDTLTTQWKEYTYTFRSSVNGPSFFYVQMGAMYGNVWLDDVRINAVPESPFVANDNVSSFSLRRLLYSEMTRTPHKRWRDLNEFYFNLVDNYNQRFVRLIKDTLKCKALLSCGNQVSLVNDVYHMSKMDYTNVASSWDFRRRTSTALPDTVWYIANDAQVSNKNGGNLFIFARTKVKDKPMVLSSYGQPFPMANINEMVTQVPAYAAYQDVDALYLTYWANTKPTMTTNFVAKNAHNEICGNPGLLSLIPTTADAFVYGKIKPANTVLPLHQTIESLQFPGFAQVGGGGYFLEATTDQRILLFRRIEIDSFNASLQSFRPHLEIPALADPNGVVDTKNLNTDTEELLWNADDTLFKIQSPEYLCANGVLRNKIVSFRNDSVIIERKDNGLYGTFTMLHQPDTTDKWSSTYLVTINSRAGNAGAVWGGDSTIFSNWGTAQMQIEPMNVGFTFKNEFDSLLVVPLDSLGRAIASQRQFISKSSNRLRSTLDQSQTKALWYIFKFIKYDPTGVEESANTSNTFTLHQISPNIISDELRFECDAPSSGYLRISIVDVTGNQKTLWEGIASSQSILQRIPVTDLSNGLYTVIAESNNTVQTQKVLILR